MDEHIVIKEIVCHPFQFLKSDEASDDTFYCKVICPKQYSLTHLIITVCHTCNIISDALCNKLLSHFVIHDTLCNKLL